jgi:hypothetical protein
VNNAFAVAGDYRNLSKTVRVDELATIGFGSVKLAGAVEGGVWKNEKSANQVEMKKHLVEKLTTVK